MFQTLSFYFLDCGEIPPPVVQVQNVSFRYKDGDVSLYVAKQQLYIFALLPTELIDCIYHTFFLLIFDSVG